MPSALQMSPRSCAGTMKSGAKISTVSHEVSPEKIASSAPCRVARRQNSPATSGTKAVTSVT